MMNYYLPETVEVGGVDRAIRYDFRAILDIIAVFNDEDLDQFEKSLCAMAIFYPDFGGIESELWQEASEKMNWFIDCGSVHDEKSPKLMDWEQDFPHIIAPINRVIGKDVRGMETLHWWTFISAYNEIGDCFFAQIVGIRDKRARGKKLEKDEREFAQRNRSVIDFKRKYSAADNDAVNKWIGK